MASIGPGSCSSSSSSSRSRVRMPEAYAAWRARRASVVRGRVWLWLRTTSIGFDIHTHAIVTPSGMVTSNSSSGLKPYAR